MFILGIKAGLTGVFTSFVDVCKSKSSEGKEKKIFMISTLTESQIFSNNGLA